MVISDHADPLAPTGGLETGGQNIYVSELTKNLTKFNWQVDVFTRWDNPQKKQITRIGRKGRVIRIPAGPVKKMPRDKIAEHLPEFTENIIEFKSRSHLDYGLIYANYWMSGWIGLKLKEIYKIPLVQLFHSLGKIKYQTLKSIDAQKVSSGIFNAEFIKNRLDTEREIFQKADFVLASSPFEKKDMLKYYQASEANIKIIPLGINPDLFKPLSFLKARKYTGWPPKQNIVLYVGRVEWRKGLGTLLYAFRDLLKKDKFTPRSLGLKIIGGHPQSRARTPEYYEFQRLRKIVQELKIEPYVDFRGSIRREKLPYYYSAANVACAPSYYEPFGLVPVEAMACGTPVVASRVGGIRFTVKNKKTGFLVPPRHHKALANKIYLLLTNLALRKKMSKEAVHRVRRKFNNNVLGRKINNLFKKLIREGSA